MKKCEDIPKLRLDVGKNGVDIWLDGKYMGDGISKVDFKAEGGGEPILHVDMNMRYFRFIPEKDLVSAKDVSEINKPESEETLRSICFELAEIRKELQTIRSSLEPSRVDIRIDGMPKR